MVNPKGKKPRLVTSLTTEERILTAARTIFIRKGFAAARMQEVADEAGMNKALLHYYYRSKEKLFHAILSEALEELFRAMNRIFASDSPLFDKIRLFVSAYIDRISSQPHLPLFILQELNRNPESAAGFLRNLQSRPDPRGFIAQVQDEIRKKAIRKIEPVHFLIHILSLCAFPFVARPMLCDIFKMSDKAWQQFLEERKTEVSTFIIESIRK